MSENDDQTQPVQPARPEGPAVPPAAPPVARRGFRERLRAVRRSDGSRAFGLGALIASALAGVIVGGIGVATVHAVTDDHRDGPGWDRGGWVQRRDDDRGPGFGGMPGGPRGVPGQVQPTTPPDDEGSAS
jgi:hypothetical protein